MSVHPSIEQQIAAGRKNLRDLEIEQLRRENEKLQEELDFAKKQKRK